MKINEILTGFSIYTTREVDSLLKRLGSVAYLSSFNEPDHN